MASTLLASRNQSHQSFMGEIPNYSNNNPRHLNPNPNPSQKPKSNKKKHFPINGRLHNSHHAVDSCGVVVSQAASDDAYSFNQRPIETVSTSGFNQGGYVTYNVSSCSRSEINELRKKLVSDLERIRNLSDRIQTGELIPRASNGKFKKLSGNKRMPGFGSSNSKEGKSFRQGSVNGGEIDGSLMKTCRQVLTKLMKHKLSWVFNKPVDAVALGLHDYHQIIKRPMDLGTVKSNISKGFYVNPVDFASDVRLVFENAMLYNPRTDEVHRMAEQLLNYFEDLFRPIQSKLASHNHNQNQNFHPVNEFSAVDELDGSSWDDVPTPDRSKKMKMSGPVDVPIPIPVPVPVPVPFVSSKQSHSTASNPNPNPNPIIPPPVVQSPIRTPSPMQPQPPEPVKPSSTTTRGTYAKLPKPRAKDPNKREMNMDEKQRLGLGLQSLPPEKMPQLLQIIRKRNDRLAQEGDEIELDIEALDTETLWELDRFVTNWKKAESKAKRQALLVNTSSAVVPAAPSVSVDIDDMLVSEKADVMKKSKKEAGEEDVDIGDEMPESSFPHVEIEKDDGGVNGGGGGLGQVAVHANDNAAGGGGGDNASSSSSGSSSSSSGDSSSSSDSDSGSSSGSDSDADDAQS